MFLIAGFIYPSSLVWNTNTEQTRMWPWKVFSPARLHWSSVVGPPNAEVRTWSCGISVAARVSVPTWNQSLFGKKKTQRRNRLLCLRHRKLLRRRELRRRAGRIRILLITWLHPEWKKESKMPQVGKKKFPYTSAGMKDAKMAAKKSGKKMVMAPKNKK